MKKEYCGIPMRFAHTGVTQFAPENSLEAFKKAAELGFEGIELDIQMCGDGEIIKYSLKKCVSSSFLFDKKLYLLCKSKKSKKTKVFYSPF